MAAALQLPDRQVAACWSNRVRGAARRGFPRGPDPGSVYPTALLVTYPVTLTFVSWNQVATWLRRLEALRKVP
jgi:hypothetical protein